ncbi:hypothetical protein STEG23_020556 [Scotinomys teguina]
MCRLSWFLDPGGWTLIGLYFFFPGICTLSLNPEMSSITSHGDKANPGVSIRHRCMIEVSGEALGLSNTHHFCCTWNVRSSKVFYSYVFIVSTRSCRPFSTTEVFLMEHKIPQGPSFLHSPKEQLLRRSP